jgi:hypothetical protein
MGYDLDGMLDRGGIACILNPEEGGARRVLMRGATDDKRVWVRLGACRSTSATRAIANGERLFRLPALCQAVGAMVT